jgi:ATP-dependent helicase/nuclease subunit A
MSAQPADFRARHEALDVTRSFIVQAPAGSGKTGLLTQRYLALLARVEQPEEIVAITFTRKAAAEMRQRILDALRAAHEPEPEKDYERQTWQLARAALARDAAEGWSVLGNPQRLRIRTIDSLSQFIGRQLPVRSGFGEVPGVVDDASHMYRAAAELTLAQLESGAEVAAQLGTLLGALDNQVDRVAGLIAAMLARRDQWLEHVLNHGGRQSLEDVLVGVIERHLAVLTAAWSGNEADRLVPLLRFAASNLPADHAMSVFAGCQSLPGSAADALEAWRAVANTFLTKNGTWRANVTKTEGFPADKKSPFMEMKGEASDLLDQLREREDLRALLDGLSYLPNPAYTDAEWALLQALFAVLKHAVSALRVVFAEQGQVDFTELSLSAINALGDDLEPTELALQLDYRIRHLLVDEFQDTSITQNKLFQRLTAGWSPGDGRTLFLVGDPMQSIYRFREAEVGLFLEAWNGALGGVPLEPLQLTVNFRSDRGVIDWVNGIFPGVLPRRDDAFRGAVKYAVSQAHHDPGLDPAVQVHPFLGRDDSAEAETIRGLITGARERGGKTAVLARSKAHLAELVEQLRAAGVRFQAVEIGALQHSPAVMDLVTLTRALIHLGDRVAWLALLHGAYVGLSLADLLSLTGEGPGDHDHAILDALMDEVRRVRLSEDGQARLQRTVPILEAVLSERGRRPLHEWVEAAWMALGGPLTLIDANAEEDAEVYFQLLQKLGADGRPVTPERLAEEVARLTSMPDPQADGSLQLMSIHKAKGLEFDCVILPGLGKGTRTDDPQLLYWLQGPGERGESELFFGPIRMSHESDHSSTTNYIKALEKEKSAYESGRLLYVAATRAKRELHLLGHVEQKVNGDRTPPKDSLLHLMWASIGHLWEALEADEQPEANEGAPTHGPWNIQRSAVPAGWALPEPPPGIRAQMPEPEAVSGDIPFEWAGEMARAVGTVVHRLLERWGQSQVPESSLRGSEPGPPTTLALDSDPGSAGSAERLLREAGVTADELNEAVRRVTQALERIAKDERGQWILSGEHAESACELPVTALIDGQVRHLIIDRTFVDETGTRWIIDYKTGTHSGGGLEHFLDEEEDRYREQLQRYVAAFRKLEDRPVRAALYFPLIHDGWRELKLDN